MLTHVVANRCKKLMIHARPQSTSSSVYTDVNSNLHRLIGVSLRCTPVDDPRRNVVSLFLSLSLPCYIEFRRCLDFHVHERTLIDFPVTRYAAEPCIIVRKLPNIPLIEANAGAKPRLILGTKNKNYQHHTNSPLNYEQG